MLPANLIIPEIHDYAGFITRDFAAATWRKWGIYRRAFPRKFRLYAVGVGKTGTHSMAAIFSRHHAVHEADFYRTLMIANRISKGETGQGIERIIRERDERLFLEMEASHLLIDFVPALVRVYPEARFILTIRDPYSWMESTLNQTLRVQHRPRPPVVGEFFLRRNGPPSSAPEEAHIAAMGLPSLDGMMGYYARAYSMLLDAVPQERLLVMRTPEIGKRLPEIAAFAGVPVQSLKPEAAHRYRGVVKAKLLQALPPDYLRGIVEKHASVLIARYFPDAKAPGAA